MNPMNYASLEASKKLVDAGIVLETEAVWFHGAKGTWHLSNRWLSGKCESIPAPSMAEVWRELPNEINPPSSAMQDSHHLRLHKYEDGDSCAYYCNTVESFTNNNPTDALIDLLILVKNEGK